MKTIIACILIVSSSIMAQSLSFNLKYSSTLDKYRYPSYSLESIYGFYNNQFHLGLLIGYTNIPLDSFTKNDYLTSYKMAGIVVYYFPCISSSKIDSSLYFTLKVTKLYNSLEHGWGGMVTYPGFYNTRSVNDYTYYLLGGYKINMGVFNFLIEFGVQYRRYTEKVDWYIEGDTEFPVYYKTLNNNVEKYSPVFQLGIQFEFDVF